MDDAFRRQLESAQAAHQAELFRLANEKQKQIEQANQKVRFRHILQTKTWFYYKLEGRTEVLCASVFIYDKYEQKPGQTASPFSKMVTGLCCTDGFIVYYK